MSHIFKMATLLFSILVPISSYAISEQNYDIEYKRLVLPYRDQNYQRSNFISFDGITNLNYYKPKKPTKNKALLILPGRTEPALRYFEIAYDLKELGYDIYLLDHRGQGFSDRLLPNDNKGHVNRFDDYVKDVNLFIESKLAEYQHIDMLSHSMGAAIHLRYLLSYQTETKKITRNILIAPMIKINFDPYPAWQAVFILNWQNLWGNGKDYIPGGKDYDENSRFQGNRTTHSEKRWTTNKNINLENPELQIGDSTIRWTLEAYKATNKVYDNRKAYSGNSMIYLQAEADQIVKNDRNEKFCHANQDCTLFNFKSAKHAILNEKDSIRNQAIKIIKSYLQISAN